MIFNQVERTGKTALHYAAANESSGGSITGEGLYGWLLTMGSDIDHEDHVRNYNIEFLYIVNPIILYEDDKTLKCII